MEKLERYQFNIIDKYFTQLGNFGYLDDKSVSLITTIVLLLDAIVYFKELLTNEDKEIFKNIIRKLKCCNCYINTTNLEDILAELN